PHVAEEMYARLHTGPTHGLAALAEWHAYGAWLLTIGAGEVAVQVKGKPRDRIMVPADADAKSVEEAAMAAAEGRDALAGTAVRKVIVAPGRLVNIVAN